MIDEDDNDPPLEFSPLGGMVTQDGITVQVLIYRTEGSDDGWALEVVDHEEASTVWNELFPTDQDAYKAFYETVEKEGIASFLDQPGETLH